MCLWPLLSVSDQVTPSARDKSSACGPYLHYPLIGSKFSPVLAHHSERALPGSRPPGVWPNYSCPFAVPAPGSAPDRCVQLFTFRISAPASSDLAHHKADPPANFGAARQARTNSPAFRRGCGVMATLVSVPAAEGQKPVPVDRRSPLAFTAAKTHRSRHGGAFAQGRSSPHHRSPWPCSPQSI